MLKLKFSDRSPLDENPIMPIIHVKKLNKILLGLNVPLPHQIVAFKIKFKRKSSLPHMIQLNNTNVVVLIFSKDIIPTR